MPAHPIVDAWEQIARDYHSGKITLEESIRRADKLINCSQNTRKI